LFVSVAHGVDRGNSGSAGEAASSSRASCCEAQAQLGQVFFRNADACIFFLRQMNPIRIEQKKSYISVISGEQRVVGSSAWFSVGVAREAVNASPSPPAAQHVIE